MTASVSSALSWWARSQPDTVAFRLDDDTVDYRTYEIWSSRVAAHLQATGTRTGDRVGLFAENCLAWPVIALGIIKAGAVIVPLNSRFKPAELRAIADDAGASRILTSTAGEEVARSASDLDEPLTVTSFAELEALREGDHDTRIDHTRVEHGADDPIAIMYTSGSTGRSKGVILTDQSMLGIVLEATLAEEGLRQGTTTLLVLPLAFMPGLVWGVLMTTVLGGTLIIERELVPDRAVRLMEEHRVQALFGVPLIYEAFSRAPGFAAADLSSIRTAIVGGAAVPVPLLQAYAAKGVLLRQIYGMTEAGGVATATLRSEAAEHPGSCGYGNIFTEVRVVDEDGRQVDAGVPGEILIKGPGMTPGYWNSPEVTAQVFTDGWLHSGDLGMTDGEGRLTFVDRLKDLIITGGINVSPIEIERALATIPGVTEVSVIPARDAKFGETPAAIVTVSDDDLTESTIVDEAEKVLSDFKVPRYVVLTREPLPRLPSGKVDKLAVKAAYADVHERFAKVR